MNTSRSILSLGLLAAAGISSADPLSIAGMTSGKNHIVSIALFGGSSFSVYAGPQDALFGSDSFEAYCVDLLHSQVPPVTFDVVAKSASANLANGSRVAQLVNLYATSVDSSDKGAALQLAIWDVLIDNGDGVGAGNFRATGLTTNTDSLLTSYLADPLLSVSTVATFYDPTFHGAGNNVNQGVIGPGGDHITNAVPEPASMAALGLGAFALRRRRKSA